ncbi:MAG: carboxypeptidase regulatory-like domain-containing protein, partial [Planctomycetaceae bacterium]|nr:carboxypeptidase regulatory-like domain-containing protein [Planctomycetaceae bacterium]
TVASAPATIQTVPSGSAPSPSAPGNRPRTAPAERPASSVESEPAYNPQSNVRPSDVKPAPEPGPVQVPAETGAATPPAAPPAEREPTPVPAPAPGPAPAPAPPPSTAAPATNPAPPQPFRLPNKQANAPTAPGEPNPPLAPTAEDESLTLPPPVSPETIQREARKPVLSSRPSTGVTPHILSGKVVSSNTGESEEGVQVTISNRLQAFADRVVYTDAFGRYAVRLADGDWIVKVTMPSGRTYAVSEITISGQQIVDSLGRNVPSLTITR